MKRPEHHAKGFTLIELMIVIAIVGILASIAMPSYRDYVRKAEMSEVVALVDSMKKKAIEHYNLTGNWPPDSAAGLAVLGATAQSDFETDVISHAHLANRRDIGQVYINLKADFVGTSGWIRHNMDDSNGMIRGTYCDSSDMTDAAFLPYVPESC